MLGFAVIPEPNGWEDLRLALLAARLLGIPLENVTGNWETASKPLKQHLVTTLEVKCKKYDVSVLVVLRMKEMVYACPR